MKKSLRLFFLLFLSLPVFAKSNQVRENKDCYWIEIRLASLPKSYEKRVALLKAKSLLNKHLNSLKYYISFEDNDMVEIQKQRNANVAVYTFKIDKKHIRQHLINFQ